MHICMYLHICGNWGFGPQGRPPQLLPSPGAIRRRVAALGAKTLALNKTSL